MGRLVAGTIASLAPEARRVDVGGREQVFDDVEVTPKHWRFVQKEQSESLWNFGDATVLLANMQGPGYGSCT
jgi:hypothetical protein